MAEVYHIHVQGHLDESLSAWFDGFRITNETNGTAVLIGSIVDQAALHGVLLKVRDLGLPLVAVTLIANDGSEDDDETLPKAYKQDNAGGMS
jgi:hypothetical protein